MKQNKQTRNTEQRKVIYDYLCSVTSHPTAEMVFQAVKKKLPKITLATVYRNLNSLAEANQILRLEINKEFRYDSDMSYHQHGVCRKCYHVFDFFQKEISIYALDQLNKSNKPIKMNKLNQTNRSSKSDKTYFQPEAVDIIFKGVCSSCSRR